MRLRADYIKSLLAVAFFSFLLLLGVRGRNESLVEGRFQHLRQTRKTLESVLKSSAQATSPLFGAKPGVGNPLFSEPQFLTLRDTVKSAAQQLQTDTSQFAAHQLAEVRLALGTVALTESRFSDSLAVGVSDSLFRKTRDQQSAQWLQAESYFGLKQWNDALPHFRRLTNELPDDTDVATRLVDCLQYLGSHTEMFAAASDLLSRHTRAGDQLALRDHLAPATEHYQNAITICSRLLQLEPRPELIVRWAHLADRLADILVLRGDYSSAVKSYDQAIEAWNRLLPLQGRSAETLAALASTMQDRADALFLSRDLDAAIQAFGKVGEIGKEHLALSTANHLDSYALSLAHLGVAHTFSQRAEAAQEYFEEALKNLSADANGAIAKSVVLNNRGCVRRISGNIHAAIIDFNLALEALKPALTRSTNNESRGLSNPNIEPELRVRFIIASSGSESEMVARTGIAVEASKIDPSVIAATIHRNLGHAFRDLGETTKLLSAFQESVALYRRLVDQQGQSDLAFQYAKSLCALAWPLATHSSDSMRDSLKSTDLALKACVVTDWKSYFALDSLAASFADRGNFSEAIKYQTQALELAPAKHKPVLQTRLNLYQTGKPFREGAAPNA